MEYSDNEVINMTRNQWRTLIESEIRSALVAYDESWHKNSNA